MCRKKLYLLLTLSFAFSLLAKAQDPVIPPTVDKVWPAGMERGKTAEFKLDGRSISGTDLVIFDAAGISGKVSEITDVPEKTIAARAGVDLAAKVVQGKKQTAKLEITASKDVPPGLHWFRIHSPLGTSNKVPLDIGSLPELSVKASEGAGSPPEVVKLPATLLGAIEAPGEKHAVQFEGRAGEEFVAQVVASTLGSDLKSLLVLSDASGRAIATSGDKDNKPDAVLTATLPADGNYTLTITDREKGGGADHFYRLNAGPLPYITGVFPLGVRAGGAAEVSVSGLNLGNARKVKVEAPSSSEGWKTVPVKTESGDQISLNSLKVAVGDEPAIDKKEPNNTLAQAQAISLPVAIDGHISGGAAASGSADEDYFRFHARKGEALKVEVVAARLGSQLDSVLEILDAQGNPIPRATIRCLNQTTTTLSDRDSETGGIRLVSTAGLHENDYLMVGDELDQIATIPDQPDADVDLKTVGGQRRAFLGTSPDVHAVDTPVYRAEILPPGAQFPSNGLPVFNLTWRNDDGGPGYGPDSRLDFVAPEDGDYVLHLKDVRGLEGPDFAYRLTVRDFTPDFQLESTPENPNIPKGGSIPLTVSANRLGGYDGPIKIEVQGLPAGIAASPAVIPPGVNATILVLSAASDAAFSAPAAIKIVGHADVGGHDLTRIAGEEDPLQLVSVMPPPDVVVTTDQREITLSPGQEVKVTLHIARQNGFAGRVPCNVENLPPGVRVVNVGLNGVLVTETQTSRSFTLRAEDWAKPLRQPIYVVAEVESNMPTRHASPPVMVNVGPASEATPVTSVRETKRESGSPPPNR